MTFPLRRWLVVAPAALLLVLSAGSTQAAVELPNKTKLEKVDFERHVMGLFGRSGCANGSCHGSFQGRGGFRLSLFGYDPEKDYAAVSRDMLGRRINLLQPENSQLMLKATGVTPHEGGQRFAVDSWQYQVLRDWIASGAPWQRGSGEVKKIRIEPTEYAFAKPGESGQLKVFAAFTDGSEENVTPFCDFRVNDDSVADVTSLGIVTGRRAGSTAVVVSYRGTVLPVRVLVPFENRPEFKYPKLEEVNYVDREVFARLKQLNIVPSESASDLEFLRRVTIDTLGRLPTPTEAREFLADSSKDKRAKKIDQLLDDPLHAALWATKFCDITGNNTDALEDPQELKAKRSQMWHDWFRVRVAKNVPYDKIVEGVLTATSRENMTPEDWLQHVKEIDEAAAKGWESKYAERETLDLFWRRQQQNVTPDQWGQKTAAAFLGVRLECAECHKHPFDRWTQVDYRSYALVFSQISVGASPAAKKLLDEFNAERVKNGATGAKQNVAKELFVNAGAGPGKAPTLVHPDTGKPLTPKALGGVEIKFDAGKDPRVSLMEWLRTPDNPFFARSFVNRLWGHYFGVGIVDPVDDFSLANPPSNEKLLNALAQDFLDRKYDIRSLERTILNSRVYQQSSTTNETDKFDKNCFARSYVRPMQAEVVVDVLNTALDTTELWGNDAPANARAIEVGSSRVNNNLAYVFRIFGRPPRTTACDCERAMEPALPQKLFLMSDQRLLDKLKTGRVAALVKSNMTDAEILDEMFMATLTRPPNDKDKELFAKYRERKDRAAAIADAMWALINTREFILNH